MTDSVKIKGGSKANMPTLPDRELGWCRDEKALYIGTPDGNVNINEMSAVTDEHIISLIDEQLGLVEDGTY